VVVLLVLLVPLKALLFFYLLTRFKLRARSSLLASLSLASYSEFGLIVGTIAVSNGWFRSEWLVIIAIALAISFVLAAPVNIGAHGLYARFHRPLRWFESDSHHPEEVPISLGAAEIVIFGMGRIGTGAYDHLREHLGDVVIGIDINGATVQQHKAAGRNVIVGDATDSDFWERTSADLRRTRLIMLAMPEHGANMYAAKRIAAADSPYLIAAVAQFPDQAEELRSLGVHAAYNTYAEAGVGFATHVREELRDELLSVGIGQRASPDSPGPKGERRPEPDRRARCEES
jgi:hypothetical protein